MGLFVLLALIFLIYLPVRHAGFVWDDFTVFQERGWLYRGEQWKQHLFIGFNDWDFYFRPLVVALFVLQARLFEGVPGPMHLVSLAMQLANVTLVVLLAHRLTIFQ